MKDVKSEDLKLLRKYHWAIDRVTRDIEEYGHNTAIAALMELLNEMQGHGDKGSAAYGAAAKGLIQLLAPFAPHMCEELWREAAGQKNSVFRSTWPEVDRNVLREETVILPVQVDGKVRARITVPAESSEDQVKTAALAAENVKKHIPEDGVKRIVVVPAKIVSIVTES